MTAERRPGEARCAACGAPIRWALTAKNGKPIPLNYDPDPAGNERMVLDARGAPIYRASAYGASPVVEVIPKDEQLALGGAGDGERFMPHHATCPKADKFRKPKTS